MHHFKVCVVDDCIDETILLCEGLKLHNYEAFAVHSGEETLERCQSGDVDLILLDIGLPDIDGFEVCARLKSDPLTRDIPVIFVTARDSKDHVARGYDLGAFDYVAKPYNLPMVMVKVESAMRTRQCDINGGSNICDTAYTDHLTGLRNQRYLRERLQEEVEKAHRHDHPVSCMILEIDEQAIVNMDVYEMSIEDLLVEIALAMRHASRNYDILARFDSSRFVAVLPHAPLEDAVKYATKIQEEIGSTSLSDVNPKPNANLAFGIVSCRNGSARGADFVIAEAMRGLFLAKSRDSESRIYARDLDAAH
ncbi:MAG: response regulator [Candidatus Hydrogenedentes bacterium]|nr:response regulator [Candidatus Hydrogenedentota bacterium]